MFVSEEINGINCVGINIGHFGGSFRIPTKLCTMVRSGYAMDADGEGAVC